MAAALTQNCIRNVYSANSQQQMNDGAIVQVLEVKKIENKVGGPTGDRYRLVISDGEFYIQAMLATQLNDKVQSGEMQASSIIRLTEYTCNEINARKVIIVLGVEVIQSTAASIGDPKNIQTASAGVPQAYGGVKAEQQRTKPTFMSKGGGAGGASAGGYGAPAAAAGGQQVSYHPIASLHPYHTRWTIKARVTAKSDKRTWQNAKGEGSLFSVDLLDSSGGQIKATMFKEALEKFYDVFQENQVYIISKGQLKPANKKFSRLPNEYELTLNSDAEVQLVEDDQDIQQNRFEFVSIEGIQKIEPNEFVDVIGVVTAIAPLSHITSKAGQELKKRALTLMDQSLCQVEVTLWGEQAEKYDEGTLGHNSVVAIKACKVSDFGGRSLSSSFQSQVFLNPDNQEAHKLAEWFAANGAAIDLGGVQNLSKMSRGGGDGAGAGAAGNVRKVLSDIKEDSLGMKEKPDFFTVRATITFFKHDWEKGSLPWYMACPTVGCNKKVTEDSGSWHCEKCSRSYPNASPRYILSLMVCDPTGSTWLTAFNDAAQGLLGGTTAEQLNTLIQQDQKDQASAYFKQNNFREYLFKIRAKAETGNDQEVRVRSHILSATPINPIAECNYLFGEIAKYD